MEQKETSKPDVRWIRTQAKPLSVNQAYYGKKIKTANYRAYEAQLAMNLPKDLVIPDGVKLKLCIHVKYSSKASDIDNCLKPFIDILQTKYSFNDNRLYELRIRKHLVPKGEEEIVFFIDQLED